MNYITLNNGVKMPQAGLGTYLIPTEEFEKTIITAYDMGYRLFDTAWKYKNENGIMQALKHHGVNREDVFITTKLSNASFYPNRSGKLRFVLTRLPSIPEKVIRDAILESFENLQTDYVDLFLIHFPSMNFIKMWKVLEELYKEGRIRAIGVSNFLEPHIEALKDISDVIPAVNQIEISPLNTQERLVQYCQNEGIAVNAMSTFSHCHSNEPRMEIIDNPIIKEIAKAHGKSTVQTVLRWMIQRQIIVIPKTWDESRLLENISIFDFELTQDEMKRIGDLDGGVFLNYCPWIARYSLPRKYRSWPGFDDPKNLPDWYYTQTPAWKRLFRNIMSS